VTNRPRRNSHRDANQQDIVDGLRRCGYEVIDVSAFIGEFDLLVFGPELVDYGKFSAYNDVWKAIEIKTDTGELTDKERTFQEEHPGAVTTARTVEGVLSCFGR